MKFLIERYLDKEQKFFDYGTLPISNNEYFDTRKAGMSFYDDYLENPDYMNKKKMTKSSIKMMTPREYFEDCALIFNSTFNNQYRQVAADEGVINHLKEVILKYKVRFPITSLYFNHADGETSSQEGRHRMFVLGELFGWDSKKYPVLYIEPDWEAQRKAEERESDYKEYKDGSVEFKIPKMSDDELDLLDIDDLKEDYNSKSFNELVETRVQSKFDKWLGYDFGAIRTFAIPFKDNEENWSLNYETWNFAGRRPNGKYTFICTSDPYNHGKNKGMILEFNRFNDVAKYIALPGRKY